MTILLEYRTHFTLNNVLKILVDTSSPVLSLVGKRAKAVLPETFLRRNPFMLKTSELNWVRLRHVRDTWSSSLKQSTSSKSIRGFCFLKQLSAYCKMLF